MNGHGEAIAFYLEELERNIQKLKPLLGEPGKDLCIPDNWLSDGGYYRGVFEELAAWQEAEAEVPFH